MIDGLKRFREPAALLVVTGTAVLMIVELVRLVLGVIGRPGLDAFAARALSLFSPATAAALVLIVAACAVWAPSTRNAARITRVSLVVALVGTLLQFAFGVIGLVVNGARVGALNAVIDGVGYLAFTLFPITAVILLWKMDAGLRRETAYAAELAAERAAKELEEKSPESADSAEDPDQIPPTWLPDKAAGVVWNTASGAAAGGQATAWGTPGERVGWVPARRETTPDQQAIETGKTGENPEIRPTEPEKRD